MDSPKVEQCMCFSQQNMIFIKDTVQLQVNPQYYKDHS